MLNAKGLEPAAVTPSHRPPHRQSVLQADTAQVLDPESNWALALDE